MTEKLTLNLLLDLADASASEAGQHSASTPPAATKGAGWKLPTGMGESKHIVGMSRASTKGRGLCGVPLQPGALIYQPGDCT